MEPSRKVLRLSFDGVTLTLRWLRERPGYVHDWAADVDGEALTIALQQRWRKVGSPKEDFSTTSSGDVANLCTVVDALADAGVTVVKNGVAVEVDCQWGHFRQHRWGTVTFTRRGQALLIESDIQEQDDSYY